VSYRGIQNRSILNKEAKIKLLRAFRAILCRYYGRAVSVRSKVKGSKKNTVRRMIRKALEIRRYGRHVTPLFNVQTEN